MGSLTMLVSGPLTAGGLGPWTPYQMLAAGWMGMAAAWLPRRRRLFWLAVYSGLWGWIYGWLTNLHFWPYAISSPDLGWEPGLGLIETISRYIRFYVVSSLGWDSIRAAGNVILIAILGPSLLKALERFRLRAHIDWQPLPESTPVNSDSA
jgi:energy-coupling factor transport system substrate-specific component